MRTTVILPDELMRQVKAHANERNATVTSVLELALRRHLAESRTHRPETTLPTPFGSGGVVPGVDLTSNASVAEAMDDESFV